MVVHSMQYGMGQAGTICEIACGVAMLRGKIVPHVHSGNVYLAPQLDLEAKQNTGH